MSSKDNQNSGAIVVSNKNNEKSLPQKGRFIFDKSSLEKIVGKTNNQNTISAKSSYIHRGDPKINGIVMGLREPKDIEFKNELGQKKVFTKQDIIVLVTKIIPPFKSTEDIVIEKDAMGIKIILPKKGPEEDQDKDYDFGEHCWIRPLESRFIQVDPKTMEGICQGDRVTVHRLTANAYYPKFSKIAEMNEKGYEPISLSAKSVEKIHYDQTRILDIINSGNNFYNSYLEPFDPYMGKRQYVIRHLLDNEKIVSDFSERSNDAGYFSVTSINYEQSKQPYTYEDNEKKKRSVLQFVLLVNQFQFSEKKSETKMLKNDEENHDEVEGDINFDTTELKYELHCTGYQRFVEDTFKIKNPDEWCLFAPMILKHLEFIMFCDLDMKRNENIEKSDPNNFQAKKCNIVSMFTNYDKVIEKIGIPIIKDERHVNKKGKSLPLGDSVVCLDDESINTAPLLSNPNAKFYFLCASKKEIKNSLSEQEGQSVYEILKDQNEIDKISEKEDNEQQLTKIEKTASDLYKSKKNDEDAMILIRVAVIKQQGNFAIEKATSNVAEETVALAGVSFFQCIQYMESSHRKIYENEYENENNEPKVKEVGDDDNEKERTNESDSKNGGVTVQEVESQEDDMKSKSMETGDIDDQDSDNLEDNLDKGFKKPEQKKKQVQSKKKSSATKKSKIEYQ